MSGLAHVGFAVSDLAKGLEFYAAALEPLGYSVLAVTTDSARFGIGGRTALEIHTRMQASGHLHVAFEVERRSQVREFYNAAIAAGGHDNGAPGIRELYSPNYYAAFVSDTDGNNVEAICRSDND